VRAKPEEAILSMEHKPEIVKFIPSFPYTIKSLYQVTPMWKWYETFHRPRAPKPNREPLESRTLDRASEIELRFPWVNLTAPLPHRIFGPALGPARGRV
jgi:hypothetical protein